MLLVCLEELLTRLILEHLSRHSHQLLQVMKRRGQLLQHALSCKLLASLVYKRSSHACLSISEKPGFSISGQKSKQKSASKIQNSIKICKRSYRVIIKEGQKVKALKRHILAV